MKITRKFSLDLYVSVLTDFVFLQIAVDSNSRLSVPYISQDSPFRGAPVKSVLRSLAFISLAACFVIPAHAQRLQKVASGKGDVNPSSGCVAGGSNTPCVVFTQTSTNTGQWTNFLFDGTQDGPFDLFLVPTTQNVTFQLTDPNVAFGDFVCGFDTTMIALLSNFCTDVDESADPASFLLPNPIAPNGSNQLTFGFIQGAVGLPTDWVFYFPAGDASIVTGSSAVPEPGTFALLACGLLAMALFVSLRHPSRAPQSVNTL